MTIKKNHIISTVFSVTGLLIVSKLLGFVKQMVTASAFGATLETDLINLSQGLIGNIQYLLVQSVLSALIAVYLHTAQQGEDASRHFAFDVWKALTVFTAMVVLFVELCAPWLARLIAPSYPAEQIEQLSRYLRLFAPVLLLLTWIAVFNGLLHANKHFVPGEMISVHQSIFLIVLAAALARTLGVQVLVLSFFAYNLWNAGYMAILSRRYWTVSRGNPFRNPAVQELLRMMGPLLLGYSLVYINQMVDKMLVSGHGAELCRRPEQPGQYVYHYVCLHALCLCHHAHCRGGRGWRGTAHGADSASAFRHLSSHHYSDGSAVRGDRYHRLCPRRI